MGKSITGGRSRKASAEPGNIGQNPPTYNVNDYNVKQTVAYNTIEKHISNDAYDNATYRCPPPRKKSCDLTSNATSTSLTAPINACLGPIYYPVRAVPKTLRQLPPMM
jgi:hypothetical protein